MWRVMTEGMGGGKRVEGTEKWRWEHIFLGLWAHRDILIKSNICGQVRVWQSGSW